MAVFIDPAGAFISAWQGTRMVEAKLARSNGHLVASSGSHSIALDDETLSAHPALESYVGSNVILGIRPEDLEDASLVTDTPAERRLTGTVRLRESLGSEVMRSG